MQLAGTDPSTDERLFQAKALAVRAATTKSSAVLVALFTSNIDKSKMRQKIQAEVKCLRASGIDEKHHLHPALLEAIGAALACKRV